MVLKKWNCHSMDFTICLKIVIPQMITVRSAIFGNFNNIVSYKMVYVMRSFHNLITKVILWHYKMFKVSCSKFHQLDGTLILLLATVWYGAVEVSSCIIIVLLTSPYFLCSRLICTVPLCQPRIHCNMTHQNWLARKLWTITRSNRTA